LLVVLAGMPGCLALKVGGRTETTAPPPPGAPPASAEVVMPPNEAREMMRQQMEREARTSGLYGYGRGATQAEEQKMAWEAAASRIEEMGLTGGKYAIKEEAASSSMQNVAGVWEAKVHVRVIRDAQSTAKEEIAADPRRDADEHR